MSLTLQSGSVPGEELKITIQRIKADAIKDATEKTIAQLQHTIPVDSGDLKIQFLRQLRTKAIQLSTTGAAKLSLDELAFVGDPSIEWADHASQLDNLSEWGSVLFVNYNDQLQIHAAKHGVILT